MDEVKKLPQNGTKILPLIVGSTTVGTATIRPDGKIDIDFNANLTSIFSFYDVYVDGQLDHISINPKPIPETKGVNNG